MSSATSTTVRARAITALVAGVLALAAGLLVVPGAADATPRYAPTQATPTTCDEFYGCDTTPPESVNPSCSLSTNQAAPGTKVTGTISNIPVGTEVTLMFDGSTVATETATADGEGETALGAVPAAGHLSAVAAFADTSGGAVMSFNVPANAAVGKHTVVFSGAGFSCDATGGVGFSVVGATSTDRGGSSLSKTGIDVALYLAVAIVLILAGWQLVRHARARRRRIARRNRIRPQQHAHR